MEQSEESNMDQIVLWFKENFKILRPVRQKLNSSITVRKHENISFDRSTNIYNQTMKSFKKKRVIIRSQPRIHKRLDQIRNMKLRDLQNDKDFMDDVDECLQNIMELPTLRKQMQSMFNDLEEKLVDARAHQSLQASSKTRKSIFEKKKRRESLYQKQLNKMIFETSKTSASNAIRLNGMLSKPWYEHYDKYKVVSGMTAKEKERIKI